VKPIAVNVLARACPIIPFSGHLLWHLYYQWKLTTSGTPAPVELPPVADGLPTTVRTPATATGTQGMPTVAIASATAVSTASS
jgi:hypothetical protein